MKLKNLELDENSEGYCKKHKCFPAISWCMKCGVFHKICCGCPKEDLK